jgi:uncharacterized coiled-coil protein SlyX
VLDTSAGAGLGDYAKKVDEVLAEYESVSNGQIKVSRYTSVEEAAEHAATDGIRPFNLDKGEGCYLGLAVASKDKKESLPYLSPQWEQALASDVARAIQRVTQAAAPVITTAPSRTEMVAAEQVKRSLPDLASVSVAEGTQKLREDGRNELRVAVTEGEQKIKELEQRLAQVGASESEQQATAKELDEVKRAQAEKFKQLAAQVQAQVAALERMKAGSSPAGTSSN